MGNRHLLCLNCHGSQLSLSRTTTSINYGSLKLHYLSLVWTQSTTKKTSSPPLSWHRWGTQTIAQTTSSFNAWACRIIWDLSQLVVLTWNAAISQTFFTCLPIYLTTSSDGLQLQIYVKWTSSQSDGLQIYLRRFSPRVRIFSNLMCGQYWQTAWLLELNY